MNTSTALVRVEGNVAAGLASLRQRMRERALDEASAVGAVSPRIWMEALERRVMLSGTEATIGVNAALNVEWQEVTRFGGWVTCR
jgi:hypothetical protein